MKHITIIFFYVFAGAVRISGQDQQVFRLDERRVAQVSGMTLVRDAATIWMDEGTLVLTEPVNERVFIAVFVGRGRMESVPPVVVEREQVRRTIGTDTVRKIFDHAFFFFTDSTRTELERSLVFSAGEVPAAASDELKYGLEFTGDNEFHFAFLNPDVFSFFYVHLSEVQRGVLSRGIYPWRSTITEDVFFQISPMNRESIQLLQRVKTSGSDYRKEIVSQFHPRSYYDEPTYRHVDVVDFYGVHSYDMDMVFSDHLDIKAVCRLRVEPFRAGIRHAGFFLDAELDVDSVLSEGKPLAFFDRRGSVWVKMDSTFYRGESVTIDMYYHGQISERIEDYIFVRDHWYPSAPNESYRKAQFDMRFELPSQYQMVSVGEMQSEKKMGKAVVYHWKTHEPVFLASINVGFFKKYSIQDDRIPPLTILMSEVGYKIGKNMERQVGADIANSLAFFQEILGPCRAKHLYVSEIPYLHGVAYPGLINLSWYTFTSTGESGWDEGFRSHEVAHQWFGGGGAMPATYHDRWLAEGFAEYFSLWYVQAILQDNDKFFDFLRKYRKRILDNRSSLFEKLIGEDYESGPIWMGFRTAGSKTRGDYSLIVYQKGAWVLHMLRNMMLDLQTMREDRFKAMMREYYQTFSGRQATTRDFQLIVEKHIGVDMSWFFDQWVYGTGIPKYIFSHKTERTAEGKFRVRCRVRQEQVPGDFQMFVPIHVDFGENRYVAMRALVKGPLCEFELPLLPLEPQSITFNPLESVLCEMDEVPWEKSE